MAQTTKTKATERLQRALDAIPELRDLESGSPQFMKWRESIRVSISHTFGGTSGHIREFKNMGIIYNSARTRSLIHLT